MLLGIPRSARCVQRFDDSLNSAIHITYRISLRSSSMREPRDPLLKVVYIYNIYIQHSKTHSWFYKKNIDLKNVRESRPFQKKRHSSPSVEMNQRNSRSTVCAQLGEIKMTSVHMHPQEEPATACSSLFDNDPSAGSPTETLLRLLLPLNDQV